MACFLEEACVVDNYSHRKQLLREQMPAHALLLLLTTIS